MVTSAEWMDRCTERWIDGAGHDNILRPEWAKGKIVVVDGFVGGWVSE